MADQHCADLRNHLVPPTHAHPRCRSILEAIATFGGSTDARQAAARLVDEFGSAAAALAAPAEWQLRVTLGDKATVGALRQFRVATRYLLRRQIDSAPIIANWQALLDYLHLDLAHRVVETFRVLHLNTRNRLIRDEIMDEGTIDRTTIHVREVIRRCLELGSAAIILVHNHPSGNPGPSNADIDITRALYDTAQRLGIALHDHLIIGSQGHVSLKAKGLF